MGPRRMHRRSHLRKNSLGPVMMQNGTGRRATAQRCRRRGCGARLHCFSQSGTVPDRAEHAGGRRLGGLNLGRDLTGEKPLRRRVILPDHHLKMRRKRNVMHRREARAGREWHRHPSNHRAHRPAEMSRHGGDRARLWRIRPPKTARQHPKGATRRQRLTRQDMRAPDNCLVNP